MTMACSQRFTQGSWRALIVALVLPLIWTNDGRMTARHPTNVVIITLDTTRADVLAVVRR